MSDRNANEWKDGQPIQQEPEEQAFEQALTRALRRVDAPEHFAARVMELAETEGAASGRQAAGSRKSWFSLPAALSSSWKSPRGSAWGWKPAWGAMAATLVAALLAGHAVREHRAEERVRASREFDVSVRITDQALNHAREQLRKAGVPLEEDGQ